MWSIGRSNALHRHRDVALPIEVRRPANARRLRLRFDIERGVLRLTCPPRASLRRALDWVAEQTSWVEAQLAAALPPEPFVPGALIPIEGVETRLAWVPSSPRTPQLARGELRCGGPRDGFERRIERFLRSHALAVLSADTGVNAALAGASPK